MKARVSVLALVLVATLLPLREAAATGGQPNVLVILTDDQRWDTLGDMLNVQSLMSQGTYYPNAFVTNSWCCPSRATILTGLYSHSTGVYSNGSNGDNRYGGFAAFNDDVSIATALQDAGYRTAFVGKYLNGYPQHHYDYVPPGWDRWYSVGTGQFYDYYIAQNGKKSRFYGERPRDYSGRVLLKKALAEIGAVPQDQPFFMFYSTIAPHGSANDVVDKGTNNAIPDPRDLGAYDGIGRYRPPAFGNRDPDSGDMPYYIRTRVKKWDGGDRKHTDLFRQRQLESLLGVDRQVGELLGAVPEDTMVVFLSDNGYSWGDHGWGTKVVPYEVSIRIPMVIRYPSSFGVVPGPDERIAVNIDVAPTVAAAAGIPEGTPLGQKYSGRAMPPEGLNLLSPVEGWRDGFALEHWGASTPVSTYCGWRSADGYTYVRYSNPDIPEDRGFEELYDVNNDFYQVSNLGPGLPNGRDSLELADGMRDRLRYMRERAVEVCDPVPPDYKWPAWWEDE